MRVYSKTRKSHYWNEDRFINGSGYSIVIDGATPLKRDGDFNEARWLVEYIKKNISRYKDEIKRRLSELCRDAFRDLPITIKDADCLPSASACWVEFFGSRAVFGVLGDCEATLVTKSNEIIRLYDDRLNALDKIAIDEMIAIAKNKSISVSEARKYIQQTLIKHRSLANKPNGYAALTLSPDAEINEKRYEYDINNIKTIYLYSDGFSQAFEHLNIYRSHEQMFRQIESIDDEIKKIADASYSDKSCDKYPRFKIIDDITVVKIDL